MGKCKWDCGSVMWECGVGGVGVWEWGGEWSMGVGCGNKAGTYMGS